MRDRDVRLSAIRVKIPFCHPRMLLSGAALMIWSGSRQQRAGTTTDRLNCTPLPGISPATYPINSFAASATLSTDICSMHTLPEQMPPWHCGHFRRSGVNVATRSPNGPHRVTLAAARGG